MAATAILYPSSTPEGYHSIISPTLRLPTDRTFPVPVGLLACQRDPLLRQLETVVIESTVHQPPPQPGKKSGKKAVLAPSLPADGSILEVVLHDTVIFPEGGGQPTDTGEIVTQDGKVWPVIQCKRHGGHPVHYVHVSGLDVADALKVFTRGVIVTSLLNQSNWDRRYDHMSMHTSQHLLSAILETHFQLPTLSWSLTASPSPCYIEVPRGLQPEEIIKAQDIANRLVFEGRRVRIEVEELDEKSEKQVPTLDTGRAVGKALPEDYTGGVNRVVIIEGVDKNPCCGTHLPSIHNLQLFILPHTETLSRSTATSVRLYFLSGPRLINCLSTSHELLSKTAAILSSGQTVIPDRVLQLNEDRRKAEKRVAEVEGELARRLALEIVDEMKQCKEHNNFVKHIHRVEDATNALGFLTSVHYALTECIEKDGNDGQDYLIACTSSPTSQSAASTTVVMIFGQHEKGVKALGEVLRKFGIKGGGKGARWSGKFIGVWREDREGRQLEDAMKSLE